MNPDEVYVPVFCPCCGYNLNQPGDNEYDTSHGEIPEVNCGWCHRKHSYAQVKRCRSLVRVNEKVFMESAAMNLLDMRKRIT